MNLIVNVNESWGIGKDGELLCRIPQDMNFFKTKTIGNTIIYGRKTLDSFPGGKPLPGRKNIVVTSDFSHISNECGFGAHYFGLIGDMIIKNITKDGTIGSSVALIRDQVTSNFKEEYTNPSEKTVMFVTKGIIETITLAEMLEIDTRKVFICGGESIYRQFLPFCEYAYVTKNDCKKEADSFFPNLDELNNWEKMSEGNEYCYHSNDGDVNYKMMCIYRNNDILDFHYNRKV